MTATFTSVPTALDAAVAKIAEQGKPWTRHILLDAEAEGSDWAVVFRGEDRAKAGSDNSKYQPPFALSDEQGNSRRFIVGIASGEGAQAAAEAVVKGLYAFYAMEGMAFSERYNALIDALPELSLSPGALAIALMLASISQNGANAHANATSGWRVGSMAETKAAKAAAKVMKDAKSAVGLVAAAAKAGKAADIIADMDEDSLAAIQAVIAARKAAKAADEKGKKKPVAA